MQGQIRLETNFIRVTKKQEKRRIRNLLTLGYPSWVPSGCPKQSPQSPCELIGNGARFRKPRNTPETRRHSSIRVQRYYCKAHKKYLSFLPAELLPRLHYPAKIVNECVKRHLHAISVPDSIRPHSKTMQRWKTRITGNLSKINAQVMKRMGITQVTQEASPKPTNLHAYHVGLIQTWSLLCLASEVLSEKRVPFHYVLDN